MDVLEEKPLITNGQDDKIKSQTETFKGWYCHMKTKENSIKSFFKNTIVKSIVLTIIPLVYGVIFPYALELENSNAIKGTLIVISIVIFLIHMVVLIVYGRIENRQKEENYSIIAEKEAKKLLKIADDTAHDVATSIHALIMEKVDHSTIEDWKYIEAKGDIICREAFNLINRISEHGEDFAVSIMFRKEENSKKGYTMSSRVANDTSHKPRSYRNFIEETQAEGYCYKTIFDKAPSRPLILPDKKAIKKYFKDADAVPYSQYLGLPIVCKKNRVVGVLQIVAYNDSIITKKEKMLKKLCDDYFCLFATLMLLVDKYENIQQQMRG